MCVSFDHVQPCLKYHVLTQTEQRCHILRECLFLLYPALNLHISNFIWPCVIHKVIFVWSTTRSPPITSALFVLSGTHHEPLSKPGDLNTLMLRWESLVGGPCWWQAAHWKAEGRIQSGGEGHARLQSNGIPTCLACTGHRGAPVRSLYAHQTADRGTSVSHHHVSGNSFDSRCVPDWFDQQRWQPLPE